MYYFVGTYLARQFRNELTALGVIICCMKTNALLHYFRKKDRLEEYGENPCPEVGQFTFKKKLTFINYCSRVRSIRNQDHRISFYIVDELTNI